MSSEQEAPDKLRAAVYEYLREHLRVELSLSYTYDNNTEVTAKLILTDPSDGKSDVISDSTVSVREGSG